MRDKHDVAIQQTAHAAIVEANAGGGYKGKKFELVTKYCDGPWGVTSKQAVDLIFEDEVPIIVTALDGRNAHLVEQVAAKSHVVMLSTLSSDPTLSRAYVPWYFRMVPDDKQQSKALVNEIYIKNKGQQVAMVALDTYDGKKSQEAFLAEVNLMGLPQPTVYVDSSANDVWSKIDLSSWDAIVLAGSTSNKTSIDIVATMDNSYAFLNFFNFLNPVDKVNYVKTSYSPSLHYVYDGVLLAVESIKKHGASSEEIRHGFRDLKYSGLTGEIVFDKLGNRILE